MFFSIRRLLDQIVLDNTTPTRDNNVAQSDMVGRLPGIWHATCYANHYVLSNRRVSMTYTCSHNASHVVAHIRQHSEKNNMATAIFCWNNAKDEPSPGTTAGKSHFAPVVQYFPNCRELF